VNDSKRTTNFGCAVLLFFVPFFGGGGVDIYGLGCTFECSPISLIISLFLQKLVTTGGFDRFSIILFTSW
jgi:hypothetical protein